MNQMIEKRKFKRNSRIEKYVMDANSMEALLSDKAALSGAKGLEW